VEEKGEVNKFHVSGIWLLVSGYWHPCTERSRCADFKFQVSAFGVKCAPSLTARLLKELTNSEKKKQRLPAEEKPLLILGF